MNFPTSAIFFHGHFEFCWKILYFTTHWRIVTKLGMCLRHHALMVLKEVGGSAILWSTLIMKFLKMLITFVTLAYCNETDIDRFIGSCWEHQYQYYHNWLNFLSAILIHVENLLFWTPRPLVQFSQNFQSSSDQTGKKLWISWLYPKRFSSSALTNLLEKCQTEAVSLQSFDIFTPNFVYTLVTSHWPGHIIWYFKRQKREQRL